MGVAHVWRISSGLRRINTRQLRWAVLVAIGVALLVGLVLLVPRLLIPARSPGSLADVRDPAKRHELEDARLKLQNDVRTTLVQAVGGAVVGLGAFFTWKQLQHNIQSSREQHELDRQQQELERQGQVTERFSRAVEHLASDKLDIRLGGIYALERIARDQAVEWRQQFERRQQNYLILDDDPERLARDAKDDRAAIGEILAAYVRGHAPWPPSVPEQPDKDMPIEKIPSLQARAADVQAAISVLGEERPWIGHGHRFNLSGIDLRRADLRSTHLMGTDLRRTHLEGADLRFAHLEAAAYGAAAQLEGAHLEGADLYGASLEGVELDSAHGDAATQLPIGVERPRGWATG